ncbi:MAG: hypothetical protein J3K34DRAFT_502974 [Monoraphidium minutum]|nr:MAG: hypothetical protein J3K34DRAFT_502974 [Monoraphidium minutum]
MGTLEGSSDITVRGNNYTVTVYKGESADGLLASGVPLPDWTGSESDAKLFARRFGNQADPGSLARGNNWLEIDNITLADGSQPNPGPWFCYESDNRTPPRLACAAWDKREDTYWLLSTTGEATNLDKDENLLGTYTSTALRSTRTSKISGFNGATYEFANGPEFQGRAYSLTSESRSAFNALVERHAGDNAFPAAGSWMTGFGLRTRSSVAGTAGFTLALRMKTDTEFKLVEDKRNSKTRALHPDGPKGRLAALFESFEVNGRPSLDALESGRTLEFPESGVTVHLPATRHKNDPTDGPIAIITTPDMNLEWYIESEDTWHLDFKVALKGVSRMHGILGQSLHWARGAPATKEGTDLEYALPDGLLGTEFAYSRFGREEAAAAAPARRLLAGGDLMVAWSGAAPAL